MCGLVQVDAREWEEVWDTVNKLTWRRVQGDQQGSDPRWRLSIALRCVEACDGL